MVTAAELSEILQSQPLHLQGVLADSSNGAYVCRLTDFDVVYKPVQGESPLWDFTVDTLSRREVAASIVDQQLGWDLVPTTVWTDDGPLGPGSIQLFVPDAQIRDVELFEEPTVPQPWIPVLRGYREDVAVIVAHADSPELRRLAWFDALVNNADRKAGHILRDQAGRLRAIDHGVCFHQQRKLRTVLWGWIDETMDEEARRDIQRLLSELPGLDLPGLDDVEIAALHSRGERLLNHGIEAPDGSWPAVPWPVF